MCDGNSRVCQFRKIGLDGRINTLQRSVNSKRLYDRYRSERSRNGLGGGWCNTVLNHLLQYSRKHDENEERGWAVPKQSVQNLVRGLQPITTKVGTRVGVTECAGQSDVRERVGTAKSPVAKPTGAVVTQRVVVRRVVLQYVSVDRRRKAVQRLGMQALSAGERVDSALRVVNVRE